ncbi:unnamed protein product [Cylicocyclus nassatus]|uniref:Uncharacterized protein n=1 Tax=Cylicocyclus nassatus TaxID=53992 RepID=A0AA36HBA8_CYLNA|nr:unnamed protein product [Cylicocyclus nassatus]
MLVYLIIFSLINFTFPQDCFAGLNNLPNLEQLRLCIPVGEDCIQQCVQDYVAAVVSNPMNSAGSNIDTPTVVEAVKCAARNGN